MADQFVAEIRLVGFNFAPLGWAACNGQLISLSQNTALFSLVGTFYGGDGKSNFGLPNLQGNVPIHQGNGAGLTLRSIGETGGSPTVTLLANNLPAHTHVLNCDTTGGNDYGPANDVWAPDAGGAAEYAPAGNVLMAPDALGITGQSQPHNNLQPYLVLNYCIALQGIFPARG